MTPIALGQAAVLLWQAGEKQASDVSLSYGLKGKLQLSHSGWLLLAVPNDLGIGAFKALNAPGAELPVSASTGRYNAHISVMRPDEVQKIGAANINERGKEFSFTLGPVREVDPAGWDEMSRCWFIEVRSPELEKLRKSYGLSALPKDGEYAFHITFAVRRRAVLRPGDAIKKMTRGSIIHRPGEFMKVSAHKTIHFPTRVTETVTVIKEICPHCNEELGEKSIYVDGEGYEYCRKCRDKGPIGKPFSAEEMREMGHPDASEGPSPSQTKEAQHGVEIKDSPIHGRGLFATRDYEPGDIVVAKAMVKLKGEDGLTNYEQSDEARFTNHSDDPNIALRKAGDYVEFVAQRPVTAGEELTGDYDACQAVLGPGFYFSYRGKRYDGGAATDTGDTDTGDTDTGNSDDEAAAGGVLAYRAVLRGMWDSNYDPIVGAGGTGTDPRSGKIGDPAPEFATPGHEGSDAGMPGSLHADAREPVATTGAARDKTGVVHCAAPITLVEGAVSTQFFTGKACDLRNARRGGTVLQSPSWEAIRTKSATDQPGNNGGEAGTKSHDQSFSSAVARDHGYSQNSYGGFDINGLTQIEKTAAVAGASLAQQIATARRQTKPPGSAAQAAAGNYPKGKVQLHGLTVAIENGKGSTRSGVAPSGKRWAIKMQHDYGYIHKTEGKDGDHVDVFIGPDPDVELVWVVNQHVDGKFDEHKVMMGFRGEKAAREGYLSNYEKGWQGLHSIVPLTMGQFKEWLEEGDQHKPVAPPLVKKAFNAKKWASRLDRLIARRDPAGISQQQWDVAMRATPVRYDLEKNPVSNFAAHLGSIREHAHKQVTQQSNHERLLNAADPDRAIRQFQAALAQGGSP